MKHLKTDKRSSMGHESVKKQSVIFGAACMETADESQMKKDADLPEAYSPMAWTDADFDSEFDMLSSIPRKKTGPRRVVKCWTEDWEKERWRKQSAVSEQKFLTKYGGLDIFDVDRQRMMHLDGEKLRHMSTGKGRGYSLIAYSDDFDSDEEDEDKREDEVEYFSVYDADEPVAAIHELIYEYYTKHPNLGVKVLKLGSQDDDNDSGGISESTVDET